MRSRVIGLVLFGLGFLALVLAAGLAFVVAPAVSRLPYDMEPTQSVAEAPGAEFLQITNGVAEVNSGTLRSTTNVQADAKQTAELEGDLDGEALVWLVGSEVVRTDTNEVISAYSTALAVDRRTAAAQVWDKAWLETASAEQRNTDPRYRGQIYKFPFGSERKTYEIFDRDVMAAQPARFVRSERVAGVETYQYVQEIRNGRQQLPEERLAVLRTQLLPGAASATIAYDNTRTVWVEPATGQFIKVQEQQHKALVGDDGSSVDILDATFTYTDETIARAAETATDNRQRLRLVGMWAPLGLVVLALLLIAAGAILLNRRPRPAVPAAEARHAVEQPAPVE